MNEGELVSYKVNISNPNRHEILPWGPIKVGVSFTAQLSPGIYALIQVKEAHNIK